MKNRLSKVVSLIVLATFLIGQSAQGLSLDCLGAALASNDMGTGRKGVQGDVADTTDPGAIADGEAHVELLSGTLPDRIPGSDEVKLPADSPFIPIRAKVLEAIEIAINRTQAVLLKEDTPQVEDDFRASAEKKLMNLFALRTNLHQMLYLFQADVRGAKNYNLGFNTYLESNPDKLEYVGLSVELIVYLYSISPLRLAQYIGHECIPEKDIVMESLTKPEAMRNAHRTMIQKLQEPIYTAEEVAGLRQNLRNFITSSTSPLATYRQIGEQIWVDGLTMDMLQPDGLFEQLVRDHGITGVTTNPSLIKAYLKDEAVLEKARQLAKRGLSEEEVYYELIKDLATTVIDIFKKYGVQGKFSVELDPTKASNVSASVEEALKWTDIDRDYMMVKVAANVKGYKIIEEVTAQGRNVNATLIFTPEQYRQVALAYIEGLKKAKAAGHDLTKIYSVASFFISRWDVALLDQIPEQYHGMFANSVAIDAYNRIFKEVFGTPEFVALGANVQDFLLASTGSKGSKFPADVQAKYPEDVYVTEVQGANVVNTLPFKTIQFLIKNGVQSRASIVENAELAIEILAAMRQQGVDLDDVGKALFQVGMGAFLKDFAEIKTIIGNIVAEESENIVPSPLLTYRVIGEQIWVDGLTMDMLQPDGVFEQLVRDHGITGVTTNPSLIKAYLDNADVLEKARQLAKQGLSEEEVYFELIKDLATTVIDIFKKYDVQGKFSVELDPTKASDVSASVEEAIKWTNIDRDYMMVKVAANEEGYKIIEEVTAQGRNVNATLIFTPEQYRQVALAYIAGLKKAKQAGHDLTKIYSVASFFISRWDVALIDQIPEEYHGMFANSVAIDAYNRIFKEVFSDPAFVALGANVQDFLLASTGSKGSKFPGDVQAEYPEDVYVTEVQGANVVNTLPFKTIQFLIENGVQSRASIVVNAELAIEILAAMRQQGVDLGAVGAKLFQAGMDAFLKDFATIKTIISDITTSVAEDEITQQALQLKTTVEALAAKVPDETIYLGIDTAIKGKTGTDMTPIFQIVRKLSSIFPNLVVIEDEGEALADAIHDATDGNFSNTALVVNINNVEFFMGLQGVDRQGQEVKPCIATIDDSGKDFEYLPVLEAAALSLMMVLEANEQTILQFYNAISRTPFTLEDLRASIAEKIINILPKISYGDEGRALRKRNALVKQIYLSV